MLLATTPKTIRALERLSRPVPETVRANLSVSLFTYCSNDFALNILNKCGEYKNASKRLVKEKNKTCYANARARGKGVFNYNIWLVLLLFVASSLGMVG